MAWKSTATVKRIGQEAGVSKRDLDIPVSPTLHTVLGKLADKGHKALIVGGAVRDSMMGAEPKDIDVEVYGTNYEDLASTLSEHGKVNQVGKAFGVIKFRDRDRNEYDFSLPRRDNKTGIGHQDFETTFDADITPKEAASRRDFTMNALAYDPLNRELHDYFGGEDDIKSKTLRHTSPAFAEDPLRVLRGMQFSARYGMKVAPETAEMSKSIAHEYSTIPKERVSEEWMKLATKGKEPGRAMDYLQDTGWSENFPELHRMKGTPQEPKWHPEGDLHEHTKHAMNAGARIADREGLEGDDRATVVLGAMLHDVGKPDRTSTNDAGEITSHGHDSHGGPIARQFLDSIGIKKSISAKVQPVVEQHMQHLNYEGGISSRTVRRLAERLHPATVKDLSYIMEADHSARPPLEGGLPGGAQKMLDRAAESNVTTQKQKPFVNGRDVMPYFNNEPGPHIGEHTNAAMEAQLNGEINSPEEGKAWLKKRLGHIPEGHDWWDENDDDGLPVDRDHDKLYHVAPTSARERIEQEGLKGIKQVHMNVDGWTEGVHAWSTPEDAESWRDRNQRDSTIGGGKPFAYDTWEIDAKGLDVQGDGNWAEYEGGPHPGSHFLPDPVPVDRIKRVASSWREVVGSWKDVRDKAVRLRNSNLVNLIQLGENIITSRVIGDHDVYDVALWRQFPGSRSITTWDCDCKWGEWAFKRQHTYVGRMCSHALATLYTAQGKERRSSIEEPPALPRTLAALKPHDHHDITDPATLKKHMLRKHVDPVDKDLTDAIHGLPHEERRIFHQEDHDFFGEHGWDNDEAYGDDGDDKWWEDDYDAPKGKGKPFTPPKKLRADEYVKDVEPGEHREGDDFDYDTRWFHKDLNHHVLDTVKHLTDAYPVTKGWFKGIRVSDAGPMPCVVPGDRRIWLPPSYVDKPGSPRHPKIEGHLDHLIAHEFGHALHASIQAHEVGEDSVPDANMNDLKESLKDNSIRDEHVEKMRHPDSPATWAMDSAKEKFPGQSASSYAEKDDLERFADSMADHWTSSDPAPQSKHIGGMIDFLYHKDSPAWKERTASKPAPDDLWDALEDHRIAQVLRTESSRTGTLTIYAATGRPVKLSVEVADDQAAITKGLMNRPMLPMMSGMVFVPPYKPSYTGFWMKNTMIDLDIAFWGRDGVITEIISMRAGDMTQHKPRLPFWGAVEVNRGFFSRWSIMAGCKVVLS